MLVSAAEPPQLRGLGAYSPLPERYGADFLLETPRVLTAVQRKTVADLIASLADGRLGREIGLMRQADLRVLLVEGRPRWTSEGLMVRGAFGDRAWTKKRWFGLQRSMLFKSQVAWVETADLDETAFWLRETERGLAEEEHGSSVEARPAWAGAETFGEHLMMSFPGIGPTVARALVRHFGGRAPLALTCTEEELRKVAGVGEMRARTIVAALER